MGPPQQRHEVAAVLEGGGEVSSVCPMGWCWWGSMRFGCGWRKLETERRSPSSALKSLVSFFFSATAWSYVFFCFKLREPRCALGSQCHRSGCSTRPTAQTSRNDSEVDWMSYSSPIQFHCLIIFSSTLKRFKWNKYENFWYRFPPISLIFLI